MDSDLEDLKELLASDSSEDDDLDILELFMEKRKTVSDKNFAEKTVPNINEETFFDDFHVSRDVMEKIADMYGKSSFYNEEKYGSYGKISSVNQVLIFLWFAVHKMASFRDVCARFNISLGSLHRIILKLTIFLSNLSPETIKWPNEEEKTLSEEYFRSLGFPNLIGVIDGSHIKIDKPDNDPDSYVNRKGDYSIQVQIVCDHKHKIIDIFVGYPGSVSDSYVFRNSPLCQNIKEMCGPYFLLGDSGYPLMTKLLTPFEDRGQLTITQTNFNLKFSQIHRTTVQHCFGLLKQRFQHLNYIKLRKISIIVHFIRACCVLHNIAIDDNFVFSFKEQMSAEITTLPEEAEGEDAEEETAGRIVREAIADLLAI